MSSKQRYVQSPPSLPPSLLGLPWSYLGPLFSQRTWLTG